MNLFDQKAVIGMVHLQALPGSPLHKLSIKEISQIALSEAKLYQEAGLDAIIIENMHDVPYLKRHVDEETSTAIAVIASNIRAQIHIPLGIQILAGANRSALAVANAAELDFIRAEGFVFGHLADEGYLESDAGELLRYRKYLDAEHIRIFTDIKKKHSSHAITADVSIAETARAAQFFLSDGIIVSGSGTGEACSIHDLQHVRDASGLPLMIGSGITVENLDLYWNLADAFIIGSYFKASGYWGNPISTERVATLMRRVNELRAQSKHPV